MAWQEHFEIVGFFIPQLPDYDGPSPFLRTKPFVVCSRGGEPFGMYETRQAAQAAAKEIAEHWST
jgi:hypothetical protein